MTQSTVVRAWKDPFFREGLSEEESAGLPDNPVGLVELPEELLDQVAGRQYGGPKLTTIFTSVPCVGALSTTVSCIGCENTLWHGTCYASSVGCCPSYT
jgi:mersacidin/lichenicidin family type 2 lantibiotic